MGFFYATKFEGYDDHPYDKYKGGWRNPLWFVRHYGRLLPEWVQRPLYSCPVCMASIHGAYVFAVYTFLNDYPPEVFLTLPLYIFALAGVNQIVHKLIE